jgi:hypothetical protein
LAHSRWRDVTHDAVLFAAFPSANRIVHCVARSAVDKPMETACRATANGTSLYNNHAKTTQGRIAGNTEANSTTADHYDIRRFNFWVH